MPFVTKKTLSKVRKICREEHAALVYLAKHGKRIDQIRIDIVLHQYESYLNMLKRYSYIRRYEIKFEQRKAP